jgi:hypothetical protein
MEREEDCRRSAGHELEEYGWRRKRGGEDSSPRSKNMRISRSTGGGGRGWKDVWRRRRRVVGVGEEE